MTWVRLDDRAPHHPKLIAAGPEAAWLWVCGLCYSNAHHTDGFISSTATQALFPPRVWRQRQLSSLCDRLESVGLWHRVDGGFLIHDYLEFQGEASKESAKQRKEAAKERQRRHRAASAKPEPVTPVTPVSRLRVTHPSQPPVPSRPVPSIKKEIEERAGAAIEPWLFVAKEYQGRYERIRKVAYEQHGKHHGAFDTMAVFAESQARIEGKPFADVVRRLLDNAFADPFVRGIDYSPDHLAKYPGKYYSPPEKPRTGEAPRPKSRTEILDAQLNDATSRGDDEAIARIRKELDAELRRRRAAARGGASIGDVIAGIAPKDGDRGAS